MRNLLPSIKFRLRVTRQKTCFRLFFRSFARRENFSSARKIFFGAKIFVRAKIWEKKIWADAIDSVQKSSKSEPSSRFWSRWEINNALATFGRIQPIVPGFIALYPPLWHKSRDDRLNSSKKGVWIFKTSNGLTIARIALISTILGRNRSRRPKLFFSEIFASPKFLHPRKN